MRKNHHICIVRKKNMVILEQLGKRKNTGTAKKPGNSRPKGSKNKPKPNGKYPFRELNRDERKQLLTSSATTWALIETGQL